jgi:hypothetical protein
MLLILLTLCLRKPDGISHLFSIAYAFAGNGWYLAEDGFAEDDSTVASLSAYPDARLEHLENLSKKSMTYENSSRRASDHLEIVTQPKEIQGLALDALDPHQHAGPAQTSSSDEDAYDEMII